MLLSTCLPDRYSVSAALSTNAWAGVRMASLAARSCWASGAACACAWNGASCMTYSKANRQRRTGHLRRWTDIEASDMAQRVDDGQSCGMARWPPGGQARHQCETEKRHADLLTRAPDAHGQRNRVGTGGRRP